MNLQVTLIVIGLVVILAVYAVSRIMEWKRTQEDAMRPEDPPVEKKSRSPFRWKKWFRSSSSPVKTRTAEVEPNFGEDDLTFMAGTDVIFGVDPDDANDRRLRPDEIENLTAPDMTDSVPILSEADVAGQYHADMRDAPDQTHGDVQPDSVSDSVSDSGDDGFRTPVQEKQQQSGMSTGGESMDESMDKSDGREEVEDIETDDVDEAADMIDRGGAQVLQESDSQSDDASAQFQYPEIEGFIRVSQIDYWIKLTGKRDVGRESALALYREEASLLTKQHQIFGQKTPNRDWRALEQEAEGARFGDLIITLQLADKDGAVGQEELDRFVTLASILAKGLEYEFTLMAPIESALKQGRAIADFIRYYDSLTIIHVKPAVSEYFEGSAINRCATQLGLDRSPEGFFVRNQLVNKNKTNLYYIANMSKTGEFDFDNIKDMRIRGVTFFTKPVLHRSPGVVFTEMSDTAKAFAARAKGNASVPDHHTLSQSYVDRNRALIEKNAREMEELGIAPGNEEAMRLF